MKKSHLYVELKKNISETYVNPFIEEAKKSGLDIPAIIVRTMYKMQKQVGFNLDYYCVNSTTPDGYLDDINTAFAHFPEEMEQKLVLNTKFYEVYAALGRFYIANGNTDIDSTRARTIINELFFEFLNPVPDIVPTVLQNVSVLKPETVTSQSQSAFLNTLSLNTRQHIASFFQDDPSTIRHFKSTCRETYRTQKSLQNKPGNLFYTIGQPVAVGYDGGYYRSHKAEIPVSELMNSTNLSDVEQPWRLFPTLFDALEYAVSKYGEGSNNNVFIPSVMAVSYLGDPSLLEFEEEVTSIHDDHGKKDRTVCIDCSRQVQGKDIVPRGALLVSPHYDMYSYRVHAIALDLNSATLTQRNDNRETISRRALWNARASLFIKEKNLANRGFNNESLALNHYIVELGKCIEEAETFISTKATSSHREEQLKEFKENYKILFNNAKKNLEHHRGNTLFYAEVFLSCITLGIYALALSINYAVNGKYTFFATETVNKLEASKTKFDEYIDCLYENPIPL